MDSQRQGIASWPRGVFYLLTIQALERAGYYGFLSVLIFYLFDTLSLPDHDVHIRVGAFTALAALSGVGGGLVADWVLGRGWSIVGGCLLMSIGGLLLSTGHADLFALSLGLLVAGSGLFSPNVPVLISTLLQANGTKRQTAFNLLYMAVNVGGVLGPIVVGPIADRIGYEYGFFIVGAARLLALILYLIGRPSFREYEQPPEATRHVRLKLVVALAAIGATVGLSTVVVTYPNSAGWWVAAACAIVLATYLVLIAGQDSRGRGKLIAHLVVVLVAIAFWTIYQQFTLSVLIFTDRDVSRTILDWLVPASVFNALNPFFVILFGPLVVAAWAWLSKSGREPNDFLKLGLGLVIAGLSFEVLRLGIIETPPMTLTSLWWIIAFQAVLAFGELMVGPVGLDLTDRLKIPKLSGFFTGVWYLSTAVAFYLSGVLAADLATGSGTGDPYFESAFAQFGRVGIVAGLAAVAVSRLLARFAGR